VIHGVNRPKCAIKIVISIYYLQEKTEEEMGILVGIERRKKSNHTGKGKCITRNRDKGQ